MNIERHQGGLAHEQVYTVCNTFLLLFLFDKKHQVCMLLLFSQLIKGLLDGEIEFVREMNFFVEHHLQHVETNHKVPLTILSQKEYIFRNIKDIASFHEW